MTQRHAHRIMSHNDTMTQRQFWFCLVSLVMTHMSLYSL